MTRLGDGGARLQRLLEAGVSEGVFPSGAALVRLEGQPVFAGVSGGATPDTVFDLASLTKVMATAATFLSLWREGAVDPATPVARLAPGAATARAGATLGDLLAHRAGLRAFEAFFAPVMREEPRLFEPACPAGVRGAARRAVAGRALAAEPVAPPGAGAVYSDVGFLVLGELLERAGGAPLDALVADRVVTPLSLGAGFRRLSARPAPDPAIAPTGATRPREPVPGAEWTEAIVARPSVPGEVDDDNAWVMDGVAGHAGLFGSVEAVAAFGQAVLDEVAGAGRIAPPPLWRTALARDRDTPGSTRALGFDTREPGDRPGEGAAGRVIGQRAPGAVGHLGFTGVSLWVDLGRGLVVALCTNRTAGPRGRAETRIRQFRPRFHDAVAEALGFEE